VGLRFSVLFRHPAIGMPDTLQDPIPNVINMFRHPAIGMPDTLGRTQSVVLIVK
jgi:hypothetical protein